MDSQFGGYQLQPQNSLPLLFFFFNKKMVYNAMNYSVARVTFGWCSISNTLGPHAE